MNKSSSKKKRTAKNSDGAQRSKWLLGAGVVVAIVALLTLTPFGRKVMSRIPILSDAERAIFGGPRVPFASMYGIDVSRYQGTVKWTLVNKISFNIVTRSQNAKEQTASVPIDFVFAKATQGATYVDPNYDTNRNGARHAGIRFGAYHVFTMAPVSKQIKNFTQAAHLLRGDLLPAIDVEESIVSNHEPSKVQAHLVELVKEFKKKFGKKPIIYCSQKYGEQLLNHEELADAPHWIARYRAFACPENADIWQFAEDGSVIGIDELVDLDALYDNRFGINEYILAE